MALKSLYLYSMGLSLGSSILPSQKHNVSPNNLESTHNTTGHTYDCWQLYPMASSYNTNGSMTTVDMNPTKTRITAISKSRFEHLKI